MAQVTITWIDSVSPEATGTKIYRNDVEIADIANGVQTYTDNSAPDDATPKYEVQAHDGAGDQTTQEVEGVNMDYITTPAVPAPSPDLYDDVVADPWNITPIGTTMGNTGSMYFEFSTSDLTGANNMVLGVNLDGGTYVTLTMGSAVSQIQPRSRYNSIGAGTLGTAIIGQDFTSTNKVAITWNGTMFKTFINGAIEATDTMDAIEAASIDSIVFQNPDETASNEYSGSSVGVKLWSTELTEAQMEEETTLPLAPDAPTVLAAGTPTDTTIPLTWTKSATGVMVEYRAYIGGVLQQTFGDLAEGTLTGLTAETLYSNITVRAWDGVSESVDSNAVSATTEVAPPVGDMGLYRFDGTSASGISLATGSGSQGWNPNTYITGADFTFVVRCATTSGQATDRKIFGGSGANNLSIFMRDTGGIRFELKDGVNNILRDWAASVFDLNDDTMHTIVIAMISGTLSFYVDGNLEQSNAGYTYIGPALSETSMAVGVGVFSALYVGDIEVIQAYSEGLDQAAVTALEDDINSYASGKVLDLNSVKSSTEWTDNAVGAIGDVGPGVTYVP